MAKSKAQLYEELVLETSGLLEGETDMIANLANVSALIWNKLPQVNWAGFYLLKGDELVLGPFQGKPACVRIPIGRGVCGTAAKTLKPQLIADVHQFEGHIACDQASNSELVIPVIVKGELKGVLDLDSPDFARFDKEDLSGLQQVVNIVQDSLS
ncbi:GAF domain-containing protein [Paraneptunicella aestuarii]|uniref:GAF domain-containing protein n=1 Tax=Paraneptunicella aestuarii TaxID=2831148 RepID=UPI001E5039C7|nr:GAF domain-containing protein [Paraneptunicella aestuarii]UAA37159.1 GAF domain-containing protein [Paraneptunicella aestuarii]